MFIPTRGITPLRVTSGEAISATKRLGRTAPKKHRSGSEPLATLGQFDRPGNRNHVPRTDNDVFHLYTNGLVESESRIGHC